MANPFSTSFTATAAAPPSMSGTTITQQAYGTSNAANPGPKTAFLGVTLGTVIGVAVILYLYTSLPR